MSDATPDPDFAALRAWAVAIVSVGDVMAKETLRLPERYREADNLAHQYGRMVDDLTATLAAVTADNEALRKQVAGLCERVASQSELLTRRAEREASRDS